MAQGMSLLSSLPGLLSHQVGETLIKRQLYLHPSALLQLYFWKQVYELIK